MKPIEPREEDCCHSDCNPCIFDVYQKQLEKYNRNDVKYEIKQNGILELEYTNFTITDVIQLSTEIKILKLRRLKNPNLFKVLWKPGDHFLMKYTSDDNDSCTRAYTPIKLKSQSSENFDFLVVIKKYDGGLVSNYLFNLRPGEDTFWRGPYGHYTMQPNLHKRIVLIAQGTGIAPFITIIDEILNNEDDLTTIFLCFCCRDYCEILFRNELYEFNAFWNFSYKIFLSNHSKTEFHNIKYKEPIFYKKFDVTELNYLKPFSDTQFLLCGSTTFMQEYETILKKENYGDATTLF